MSESEGLGFAEHDGESWTFNEAGWATEMPDALADPLDDTAQPDNGPLSFEMSGEAELEDEMNDIQTLLPTHNNDEFPATEPSWEAETDAEASASTAQTTSQPSDGTQSNQRKAKKRKKKPTQHPDEIVFHKGMTIKTIPSLGRRLKDVTECVVGLQYVWEYRSPSKSFPPHYVCKLCAFARFQNDMIPHLKGWKHIYKYMRKVHPDKVNCEEEQASKDPTVRQVLKTAAAEVEQSEGRGQIKVIMKEPCDVPAFKELRAGMSNKLVTPPLPPAKVPQHGPWFPKSNDGPFRDFGGYPQRSGFSRHGGYGYSDEYHMGNPHDPNILLSYLDTFRIENEGDAQIVLKVTQKLTDMLMEYRLRNMPRDQNHSMNSGGGYYSSRVNTNKYTGPLASHGGQQRY
ncbi:uncharacterized protein si:ch211-197h24.6 [Synchiropus splendidus]|uniref:uncharacterized protein si:ch211-197h24.6 n=1 Tax=Synchiropus splendidus TaxID=270530 RepID=UPI00237D9BB8|nr:uncharacterized protein si:ch211-197h24.6 [Synchiropus splendidus]